MSDDEISTKCDTMMHVLKDSTNLKIDLNS